MKLSLSSLKTATFVAALASSISLASAKNGADDGAQGGDISGSESIHQKAALTTTEAGPAGSGGKVELEAENEHGTSSVELKLELFGLATGTYSVSATLKSDGSTVALGSFDYTAGTTGEPGDDNGSDDSAFHGVPHPSKKGGGSHEGEDDSEFVFGENGTPLPEGLNPLDLATISISDSSSVALLTADLTSIASTLGSNVEARVAIVASDIAPDASGEARLKSKSKNGKQIIKQFRLKLKDLPPSLTYDVAVNDENITTATSDKHGKLSINRLPGVDAFSIHSVKLLLNGVVAVEADF